jgi:hypothetical protein
VRNRKSERVRQMGHGAVGQSKGVKPVNFKIIKYRID